MGGEKILRMSCMQVSTILNLNFSMISGKIIGRFSILLKNNYSINLLLFSNVERFRLDNA